MSRSPGGEGGGGFVETEKNQKNFAFFSLQTLQCGVTSPRLKRGLIHKPGEKFLSGRLKTAVTSLQRLPTFFFFGQEDPC